MAAPRWRMLATWVAALLLLACVGHALFRALILPTMFAGFHEAMLMAARAL